MTPSDFSFLVKRIAPWLQRAEGLLRPRLTSFTLPPMEYVVGLLSLLLAALLAMPIPPGDVLPALAISLMALGVVERDGLWVRSGLTVSVAAVFVVYRVPFAMVKATLYFLTQVL